jgi:hypothetical protein
MISAQSLPKIVLGFFIIFALVVGSYGLIRRGIEALLPKD